MDRATRTRLALRATVLKALAHPTRLFLVERLQEGEASVQELTDAVGADVSTVSRHLAILRHAGILAAERRGQQVFHALRTPCVLGFFECVEGVLEADGAEASADACALPGGCAS